MILPVSGRGPDTHPLTPPLVTSLHFITFAHIPFSALLDFRGLSTNVTAPQRVPKNRLGCLFFLQPSHSRSQGQPRSKGTHGSLHSVIPRRTFPHRMPRSSTGALNLCNHTGSFFFTLSTRWWMRVGGNLFPPSWGCVPPTPWGAARQGPRVPSPCTNMPTLPAPARAARQANYPPQGCR